MARPTKENQPSIAKLKLEIMIDEESLIKSPGSKKKQGISISSYEVSISVTIADLVKMVYLENQLTTLPGIPQTSSATTTHNNNNNNVVAFPVRRQSVIAVNSIKEYGIFDAIRGKWLDNGISVQDALKSDSAGSQSISVNAILWVFGRKLRITCIRYLDSSMKSLLVDYSKPVQGVITDICSVLGIEYSDELGLIVAADYTTASGHHPTNSGQRDVLSEQFLKEAGSITSLSAAKMLGVNQSMTMSPAHKRKFINKTLEKSTIELKKGTKRKDWKKVKRKQISKKRQLRLDTPWLDPDLSLPEQDVTQTNQMILVHRFFYQMDLTTDSRRRELLFSQCKAKYLAGELFSQAKDCYRFSALLCQLLFGDYRSDMHTLEWVSLVKKCIIPFNIKPKSVAKSILTHYQSLIAITSDECQLILLKLWSAMPLFGYEFYSCTNVDSRKKCILGLSKQQILYAEQQETSFSQHWALEHLRDWEYDKPQEIINLILPGIVLHLSLPDYSGLVAHALRSHLDHCQSEEFEYSINKEFILPPNSMFSYKKVAKKFGIEVASLGISKAISYQSLYEGCNPMFTAEEIQSLQDSTWENPAFEDLGNLVDERFNFLDDCDSVISEENLSEIVPPSFAISDSPKLTKRSIDEYQIELPSLRSTSNRPKLYNVKSTTIQSHNSDSDPPTPVATPPSSQRSSLIKPQPHVSHFKITTSNLVSAFEKIVSDPKKEAPKTSRPKQKSAPAKISVSSKQQTKDKTFMDSEEIRKLSDTGVIINAFETLHKSKNTSIAKILQEMKEN